MRTVAKALVALCLLWNLSAFARQPTPFLPDSAITPGDVFDVTMEDICTPGYAKKVRAVTKSLRDKAFKDYGLLSHQRGEYQLDHLIPLALGGSNSIKNLWPQPNVTSPWNARVKDALEIRLHKLVCSHQIDLKTAQDEIASDWTEAYRRYIGTRLPVAARGGPLLAPNAADTERQPKVNAPSVAENEVWVNLRSSVYWKLGSQFYGKTKQGKFMTERDATTAGYRPARGRGY
jgi:hypothetical protein